MKVDLGVPSSLLAALRAAVDAKRRAEQAIEDHILARIPIKKNDVARDKNTGATYRVDRVSAWRDGAVIIAYRTYSTGRREARSSTTLNFSQLADMEIQECT